MDKQDSYNQNVDFPNTEAGIVNCFNNLCTDLSQFFEKLCLPFPCCCCCNWALRKSFNMR